MPKLSIITINRNNAEGLFRTIKSVVCQTLMDYEYIIIDGASTDGSVDVIKQYEDKISYWVSEPDNGIYNAMNKGIKVATGEYLQFLNSGDALYTFNVLENIFYSEIRPDIIYGNVILKMQNKSEIKTNFPTDLTLSFFIDDMLCHQGIFFKSSLFEGNLYNENYRIASDFDFLILNILIKQCSYLNIEKCIAIYENFGLSTSDENIQLHQNERKLILENYFSKSVLTDYSKLNCLKKKNELTIYKYINYIIGFPKLHKYIRKALRLVVIIHSKITR